MIERDVRDEVLILRLAHGKASALDLELLEALAAAAAEFAAGAERVAILTGTGSIFSAGVDLKRLLDGGAAYVERFLPALDRAFLAWFELEKPTIAAINGHAIAGGCVIAATCDSRVMASGSGRIGLPELQVGVAFPPTVLEIVRTAIAPTSLTSGLLLGETFSPDQALAHGLVHEVVPPERLLDRALEIAGRLARLPAETLALTKRQLRAPALEAIARTERRMGADIAALWKSEAALRRVAAYVEKTLGAGRV